MIRRPPGSTRTAPLFPDTTLFRSFGFGTFLLVYLPVVSLAAIAGVWLFSVQHRAPRAVWLRDAEWSLTRAALESSTHLRLPKILQWFSGNIGFHHIHHLDPRIPNFRRSEEHPSEPQSLMRNSYSV